MYDNENDKKEDSKDYTKDNSDEILTILSDKQSREIIKILSKTELTIQQISNLLNIPQSTAYRKIRKLEDLKILKKPKLSVHWKDLMRVTTRTGHMR